ncbi:MAG: hypothetical protein M3125_02050, partial [Gemmatimonadota bacterium]|nr:hypothetical protein [Gemmatimonadota bacterium]
MAQTASPIATLHIPTARLAKWSSAFAAAVGVLVLIGWYTGASVLLRIHPSFVAMQFNTALAFTMMATGVVASIHGVRWLAFTAAFVVAIFSAAASLQYLGITGASLDGLMWYAGVDVELRPLTEVKTSSPGRMAPNTALCFLLASAAVASLSAAPRSRRAGDLSLLAGVAIGGIALLALLGYLGGAPSAYGWGGLTRMAVHTAFAMVAVGLAVASLAALRVQALGERVIHRLPPLVAVGGAAVTFGLWLAAADYHAHVRDRVVESTATELRDDIADQIRPRLMALSRMRERWEFRETVTRGDFENEAHTNIVHFPGYRAIAWVTSRGEVSWRVGDGREDARGLAALLDNSVRAAGGNLRTADSLVVAEWMDPGTREGTLVALLPLRVRARDAGYIMGVVSIPRMIELALRDEGIQDYTVSIHAGSAVLYGDTPSGASRARVANVTLAEGGIQWTVAVTPSASALAALDSPLPGIVALVGVLLTALLVWSTRMVQVAREHELERLAAIESAKDAEVARERAVELGSINEKLRREITERERVQRERESVQQQLSQAQKMEAVGQLAGGVAHDFNNLLTVITSYCELLLEDIPAADARRADVEEVLRASGSAARLTRQLLAFSRQQILQPEALDLNVAVTELEKMLRRLLPADIRLGTSLSPELGTVIADRGQLEQVVVNLVVNARDAMPNGGDLVIA